MKRKQTTPAVLADDAGSREIVLLWDLWKTLARGTYPEPIADLQRLLNYKCCDGSVAAPCPEFLNACLTTSEKDPRRYMDIIANRFGLLVPSGAYSAFENLIHNEQNGLCLFVDVLDELTVLKGKGYRHGLVSNVWPFPVPELMKSCKLESLFEHVILSCEVGIAKPDTRIFRIAAEKFGVAPEQCIMIGDNPDLDITGALAAKMRAVHIDRYGDSCKFVDGVPVIGNIRELYVSD